MPPGWRTGTRSTATASELRSSGILLPPPLAGGGDRARRNSKAHHVGGTAGRKLAQSLRHGRARGRRRELFRGRRRDRRAARHLRLRQDHDPALRRRPRASERGEDPHRQRGAARAEIERRTAEILKLVGLSDFARRPVVSLSGGQMQRVALARSLVYEPALLLLDEPLSNLDANLRLRLRDDLRRIIKRTGVTALYVTHDQAEAAVLGDRVGVMRDGRLLQIGPPAEIYNRPAELFVAQFTGASNLLAGRVLDRDGEFGTVEAPSGHRLVAWLPPRVSAGAAVRIAVRPENVRFGADGAGGSGPNRFTARVLVQRYEGAQTVYSLAVLGGKLAALELGSSARYAVDSEVDIVLPPALCWAYPDEEDAVAK